MIFYHIKFQKTLPPMHHPNRDLNLFQIRPIKAMSFRWLLSGSIACASIDKSRYSTHQQYTDYLQYPSTRHQIDTLNCWGEQEPASHTATLTAASRLFLRLYFFLLHLVQKSPTFLNFHPWRSVGGLFSYPRPHCSISIKDDNNRSSQKTYSR